MVTPVKKNILSICIYYLEFNPVSLKKAAGMLKFSWVGMNAKETWKERIIFATALR